jgi:hypothetical protein
MGEFIEPGDDRILARKVFTQDFFEDVVQKSIDSGEVKKDAKLVFIAAADERGVKAIVAVEIIDHEIFKVKLNTFFEHQWDGENKAGAKVIFSM